MTLKLLNAYGRVSFRTRIAAFEAQLEAELAAQEMMAEIEAEAEMARQAALEAFQQKLADEKAAAARSTAIYQARLTRADDQGQTSSVSARERTCCI